MISTLRAHTFIAFLLMFSATLLSADQMEDLDAILQKAENEFQDTGQIRGQMLGVTSEALKTIKEYIGSADSGDWSDPSQVRLDRINAVGEIIQMHQSLLLELGFPEGNESFNPNARSLIYYANPNDDLRQQLIEVLNESNDDAYSKAVDLLVNLRMDDDSLRSRVIKKLEEDIDKDSLDSSLFNYAKNWKWDALVSVYDRALTQVLEEDNPKEFYWDLRLLMNSVNGMGADAEILKPKLKKAIELLKTEETFRNYALQVSPGSLDQADNIVYRLENDIRFPSLAINGSGRLSQGIQSGEDHITEKFSEKEKVVSHKSETESISRTVEGSKNKVENTSESDSLVTDSNNTPQPKLTILPPN